MILLILFAFLSGIVTIFSPCIWPILPIVLSGSVAYGKHRPLGIVTGLMLSFTLFTLLLSSLLRVFPIETDTFRLFAVGVMSVMGLMLIVPVFGQYLEAFLSRFGQVHGGWFQKRNGFKGGFVTGFAVGMVWSPCAGPILATVATVAATQALTVALVLVTVAFVLGVGIPLFILALLGRHLLTQTKSLTRYTKRIQQVFGVVMIASAVALYAGLDILLQERFAAFCSANGITIFDQFQTNPTVKGGLEILQNPGSARE